MTLWLYCQGGFYQVADPAMGFKNARQVKKHYQANIVRAINMDRLKWLVFEPDRKAREQLARDHLENEFMGWEDKKPRTKDSFRMGMRNYSREGALAKYLGDRVPLT